MNRRKERIDRGVKARSADIFALTSYREMLYLLIPGAIPVVGLLCFTPILSDYWREVMISTAIYALLAMSWDMLMCAGLLSLGQSLFFGIGSYLAGSLNHAYPIDTGCRCPLSYDPASVRFAPASFGVSAFFP